MGIARARFFDEHAQVVKFETCVPYFNVCPVDVWVLEAARACSCLLAEICVLLSVGAVHHF